MKSILTGLILLLSIAVYSQTKEESFKELKSGKLYVMTYDTTETTSQDYFKQYNRNVRRVFGSKRWDFCAVEYIQIDKIEALMASNGEAFLLIPMQIEFTTKVYDLSKFNQRSGGEISYLKLGRAKEYVVRKQFLKKNKYVDFKKQIHASPMANFNIASMFIGVDYMQRAFYRGILTKEEIAAKKEQEKTREKVSNIQKIKTKTLYIDKDQLDGLTESDIKTIYTHPFKVTGFDEIIQAIEEKRANVTFIQIQMGPATQNKDILMVIDVDDYNNLAYFTVDVGLYKLDKDIFEKLNKIANKE
jgi:hypothetical protein